MASSSFTDSYSLDLASAKQFADIVSSALKDDTYPSRPQVDVKSELERSEQLFTKEKPLRFRYSI